MLINLNQTLPQIWERLAFHFLSYPDKKQEWKFNET